MSTPPKERSSLRRLTDLVARLRAPDGCPWDREQELADLRPFLIEEAHEAAAAVDGGDWDEIREELGDLLFQVAFLTTLAGESGAFSVEDVIDGIETKMVDRHPHVFGEERLPDSGAVRVAWEKRKASERSGSVLDGVPTTLPALVHAYRVTQKASGVGFDWAKADEVKAKLDEEIGELEAELEAESPDPQRLRDEIGDVLFTVANLARHLGIDPEGALASTNGKFARRFRGVEQELEKRGTTVAETELEELDRLWTERKKAEREDGDVRSPTSRAS